jgi:cyanate lyase
LEEVREGRTVFAEVPESPAWKVWEQVVRTSKTLYRTKEIIDLRGRPTLRIMIPEKWFGDSV